jgi:hypothetical protein
LGDGDNDRVGYIDYESMGYMIDPATGIAVGIRAITSAARSYAAINTDMVLSNGITDSGKFALMTSGFQNVSYDIPGNYSHLLAVGPYQLMPGEAEVVAYSFVAGHGLAELEANAQQSFLIYPGLTEVSRTPLLPEAVLTVTNYPNPFNSSTMISVNGGTGKFNAITIFDVAGRLVRSLPLIGGHDIIWDGTNDRGNPAASGVYFIRIDSNSSTVRKITLLR